MPMGLGQTRSVLPPRRWQDRPGGILADRQVQASSKTECSTAPMKPMSVPVSPAEELGG